MTTEDWLDRWSVHLAWYAEHHVDPVKRERCKRLLKQINPVVHLWWNGFGFVEEPCTETGCTGCQRAYHDDGDGYGMPKRVICEGPGCRLCEAGKPLSRIKPEDRSS